MRSCGAYRELVGGLFGQPGIPGCRPAEHVTTIETLNLVTTIGGGVLGLAGVLFILLRSGRPTAGPAARTRGTGHTLEWATSSPPPAGNFASLPKVTSEAPLYDARHRPEEADA